MNCSGSDLNNEVSVQTTKRGRLIWKGVASGLAGNPSHSTISSGVRNSVKQDPETPFSSGRGMGWSSSERPENGKQKQHDAAQVQTQGAQGGKSLELQMLPRTYTHAQVCTWRNEHIPALMLQKNPFPPSWCQAFDALYYIMLCYVMLFYVSFPHNSCKPKCERRGTRSPCTSAFF